MSQDDVQIIILALVLFVPPILGVVIMIYTHAKDKDIEPPDDFGDD